MQNIWTTQLAKDLTDIYRVLLQAISYYYPFHKHRHSWTFTKINHSQPDILSDMTEQLSMHAWKLVMDSLGFLLWSRLHLIFLPAPHAHVYFKDFSFCSYWVVFYAHRHMLVNPLIQILRILIVVFCVCVCVCVCVFCLLILFLNKVC